MHKVTLRKSKTQIRKDGIRMYRNRVRRKPILRRADC